MRARQYYSTGVWCGPQRSEDPALSNRIARGRRLRLLPDDKGVWLGQIPEGKNKPVLCKQFLLLLNERQCDYAAIERALRKGGLTTALPFVILVRHCRALGRQPFQRLGTCRA